MNDVPGRRTFAGSRPGGLNHKQHAEQHLRRLHELRSRFALCSKPPTDRLMQRALPADALERQRNGHCKSAVDLASCVTLQMKRKPLPAIARIAIGLQICITVALVILAIGQDHLPQVAGEGPVFYLRFVLCGTVFMLGVPGSIGALVGALFGRWVLGAFVGIMAGLAVWSLVIISTGM